MNKQKFRQLKVWNKSIEFIGDIYKVTGQFPKEEIYGLTSQIRRAATSIALNIAEGSGAGSDKEFGRFLTIAKRSAYEAMCGIEVALELSYVDIEVKANLLYKCDEIAAMLGGLTKKLKAEV